MSPSAPTPSAVMAAARWCTSACEASATQPSTSGRNVCLVGVRCRIASSTCCATRCAVTSMMAFGSTDAFGSSSSSSGGSARSDSSISMPKRSTPALTNAFGHRSSAFWNSSAPPSRVPSSASVSRATRSPSSATCIAYPSSGVSALEHRDASTSMTCMRESSSPCSTSHAESINRPSISGRTCGAVGVGVPCSRMAPPALPAITRTLGSASCMAVTTSPAMLGACGVSTVAIVSVSNRE
mmetsp:Transcript_21158/g.68250  ORF Transcript_21158/g.68250 Transcript_21158/m.68250 type:complete len:240 (+) Transcript_21158:786-1505(+)